MQYQRDWFLALLGLCGCLGACLAQDQHRPTAARGGEMRLAASARPTTKPLHFAGPQGPVSATWIAPASGICRLAILFQHQLGADRHQFLAEAQTLARSSIRAASLLVDAPFSPLYPDKLDLDWRIDGRDAEVQRVAIANLVIAVDLLGRSAPGLPLAYVGHSYGANWGVFLARERPRVGALILIAGVPSVTDTMRDGAEEWRHHRHQLGSIGFGRYRDSLRPYDPITAISAVAGRAILMQFGKRDPFIDAATASGFAAAITPPAQLKFYDAGHDVPALPAAREERETFLRRFVERVSARSPQQHCHLKKATA